MKYYTEPLVNEVQKKNRFKAFFLGDARRTCFYQATHKENGTYLLWIEGINWGKTICYPCVMIQGAETLVFENSNLDMSKENNQVLIDRWQAAVDGQRIQTEYEVSEMDKNEFHEVFSRYRKMHLDWAIAQAEAENGLGEQAEKQESEEESEE